MQKWILYLGLTALFAVVLSAPFTFAESAKGSPFDEIWKAINDVRTQVANLSLKPGPQGQPGKNGKSFVVEDANDQKLGSLMSMDYGVDNRGVPSPAGPDILYTTYLSDLGIFARFLVDPSTPKALLLPLTLPRVAYDGSDCTGKPYIAVPDNNIDIHQLAVIRFNSTRRHYRGTTAPPVLKPAGAMKSSIGPVDGTVVCANGVSGAATFYEIEEITLPFSLQPA